MKKFLTVFFALAILSCKCFGTELDNLATIEKEIFGIEYRDDNTTTRLNRLEKHLFGQTKTGANTERINRIAEVSGISFMPKPTQEQQRIAQADLEPEDSNVSYPIIDMMENEIFKKIYQGENVYKRVERLEQKTFGKIFDGDLSQRTDKLKASILTVKPEKITYDENYNPSNFGNKSSNLPMTQYNNDNEYFYTPNPLLTQKAQNSYITGMAAPLNQSYYNSYGNNTSDFEFALSAAENMLLGKTNNTETVHERLNKLEKKIFKKTYSGDHLARLDRIVTAAQAQKTGKMYKENKWDRYISTGIQIGTIVLMILAMIL
ncbi:hypothetical protein IJG14_02220 [bacterium]|nr:hypothetical protein [bacterium]